VLRIITDHLNKRDLPVDESGIYFVIGASDVEESSGDQDSFGHSYCGYHFSMETSTSKTAKNRTLFGSFVGNPEKNYMSACALDFEVYYYWFV
jgi:hypothetical protein